MVPVIKGAAIVSTATDTSQQLTLANGTTLPSATYLLTSSVPCWIKLGTNPTAAASTAGNTYLPANVPVAVLAQAGFEKLAVLRDGSTDGVITATPIA